MEADRTALSFTKDPDGVVYLFETIKEQNKEARNAKDASWFAKLFVTPSGDCVPYALSHQLESSRIKTIRDQFLVSTG